MKNKIHIYMGVLVFVLSCLYLIPFVNLYYGGDEGFLLTGAQRLLRGEVIYRDFYNFLTPGSYIFLALLFKIFGVHILVAHIAALLIGALLATLTYFLGEKLLKNRYLALLPPFMILVAGFPDWFIYSYHWFSTTLALAAIYLIVLGEEAINFSTKTNKVRQGKKFWLYLLAGLFAAFTLIVMQSKGLLIIVALGAYLLLFSSNRLKNIRAYFLGVSGGLGILFLYLLFTGALNNFFYFTFMWPLTTKYRYINAIPYFHYGKEQLWRSLNLTKEVFYHPNNFNLLRLIFESSNSLFLMIIGYLSILAIPLAFVQGWKIKQKEFASGEGSVLCLYSMAALAFFISSWHRPDLLHLIFGATLPLILFFYYLHKGIIVTRIFKRGEHIKIAHTLGGLFLFILLVLLTINTISLAEYKILMRFKRPHYAIETPRGRLWTNNLSYAQDYSVLLPYLKTHLKPQEPFIVFYNQPIVYFFVDAHNPLPTDFFLPHLPQNNRVVEMDQVLRIMEQAKPRFILKDRSVEYVFSEDHAKQYPNANIEIFKHNPVEQYIEANYQQLFFLNNFTLYQKKDL